MTICAVPVTYCKQNVMPVTRISAFTSAPCSQKQITNINYPTMGRKGERVAETLFYICVTLLCVAVLVFAVVASVWLVHDMRKNE